MNRDDIIRLAIQCQLVTTGNRGGFYMDALAAFAALVAAHEREACAKIADQLDDMTGREIAANIMARGEV